MKKKALILTNSNLFTVYSQVSLAKFYNCSVLHLQYSNEKMSRTEHFIQQIKEVFDEDFYNRGLTFSRYDFTFNNVLIHRLDTFLKNESPSIIFFEMKTCKPNEWLILDHIQRYYNIPVAVFIPSEEDNEEMIINLCKYGVKEVITVLDDVSFENIAKRNTITR